MLLRLFLLLLLSLTPSHANSIPDGCACENGGTCRSDSPYCACPMGWTGAVCDVQYESCHSKCLNGGKCLEGELDDFGNVQNFCKCDEYHTGKYCQHSVVPEAQGCNFQNQDQFCLHGGACNPGHYPDSKTTKPCLCQTGYTGDRCEETVELHTPTTDLPSSPETVCDLQCQHGTCAFGQLIGHPDGWEAPSDTMHCQCDDGFGGAYCELQAEDCGAHKCYNGATCIQDDDTGLLHCDCSSATSGDTYYAGQFCQYPSDDYCGYDPQAGHLFCVNGGKCPADLTDGCTCEAPFAGYACEFKTTDTAVRPQMNDMNECELECQNGGICREGSPIGATTFERYHEHCVCPETHTGPLCEQSVEDAAAKTIDCGKGRHVCPNSEKCVAYGDELLCECGNGSLATFFEGQHCQHPDHDICTIGVTASQFQSYHQVVPTQQLSYCVNGGRCKSAVAEDEPHPGCNCEEGFLGPHCELIESNPIPRVTFRAEDSSGDVANHSNSNKSIFRIGLGVIMVMVMSVFVVVFVHTARRRRKQRFSNEVTSSLFWSSGYSDEPQMTNIAPKRASSLYSETPRDVYTEAVQTSRRDMAIEMSTTNSSVTKTEGSNDQPDDVPNLFIGPPRDEDGHELHNVEIV